MRLKLHPLFFALALVLVLTGQAIAFLCTLAAVALHEAGHAAAARMRGYIPREITLMPFGAAMGLEDRPDARTGAIVAAAGPAASLLAALVTAGVWWLFPAVYPYTRAFMHANLVIGLFNLLPVYPLDGSLIVLSRAKRKLLALRVMRGMGIAASAVLLALFVLSLFYSASFTLCVAAVFVFYGATVGTAGEMYASVLDAGSKNYSAGVTRKRVLISSSAPVARCFRHVDGRSVTVFTVVDGENGKPIPAGEIDESRLRSIAAGGKLSRTLGDCLSEEKEGRGVSPARGARGAS